MHPILTSRLILHPLTSSALDSPDLRDFHTLASDPGANLWSIAGPSTSLEASQAALQRAFLPSPEHPHLLPYGVYLRDSSATDAETRRPEAFVGRVSLSKLISLPAPIPSEIIDPPGADSASTLSLMVGYAFLEKHWGKGYATEAVQAVVDTWASEAYWGEEYEGGYVVAVVGDANARSRRVMEKAGFEKRGVHRWDGENVWIGGGWQPPEVGIWGKGPWKRQAVAKKGRTEEEE